MDRLTVDPKRVGTNASREEECTELVRDLLNAATGIEEEYPSILTDCAHYGMSERDLWQKMALYLKKGITTERGYGHKGIDDGCEEKLRKRILFLIRKLPYKSLDEFRGLIAFTDAFLARAQFICDLLVYLFAEREKGLTDGDERQPRLYIEFFTDKLFWELGTIRRIGRTSCLKDMERRYTEWLADRILGGEVLV